MSNSDQDASRPNGHRLDGYKILEQPYGTRRKVRVVLMGAGASALCFFKKADDNMQNLDIVCYEKNNDIGGTWLENRYPGCACDIPSVVYQFTWKPKLWSHYYSYAPEIWNYLKEIETEGDYIRRFIKLRHRIERAEWNADSGRWMLRVRNLQTDEILDDEAEFFINSGGFLNKWKLPNISGLQDFKGKLMHSAAYDDEYDVSGKRVAVVGSGSSGVQLLPAIAKRVDRLYHWIRSPIWYVSSLINHGLADIHMRITAGFVQAWAAENGTNFAYTQKQLDFLRDNPKKYLEYRKQIEHDLNQRFKFMMKNSPDAKGARAFCEGEMRRRLKNDQRLCDHIIPKDFNPGCRRPTPAPGYLEALVAPNATVFTEPIARFDATGFFDQAGNHYEIDALVCATGFDNSWIPSWSFIGKDNISLRELWGGPDGVTSYLAVGIPCFPNHFSYSGPYGPVGHGSFMPLIECMTDYMLSAITKVQVENIKSMTPQADISRQWREHADTLLQRTSWTQPCRSWYKQGKIDGTPTVWPGSRLSFLELLKVPRWEDFDIEYRGPNRFAFLGNGFEIREFDGRDITYYLGNLDEGGGDRQPEFDEGLVKILGGMYIESS